MSAGTVLLLIQVAWVLREEYTSKVMGGRDLLVKVGQCEFYYFIFFSRAFWFKNFSVHKNKYWIKYWEMPSLSVKKYAEAVTEWLLQVFRVLYCILERL